MNAHTSADKPPLTPVGVRRVPQTWKPLERRAHTATVLEMENERVDSKVNRSGARLTNEESTHARPR
jgi:hypothetical protein